jgi:hypothetical protein
MKKTNLFIEAGLKKWQALILKSRRIVQLHPRIDEASLEKARQVTEKKFF